MTAPGVQVTSSFSRQASAQAGVIPGTIFMAMVADVGVVGEVYEVRTISELEGVFGDRDTRGLGWDALDVAFREGAPRAFVTRIVGPTPVEATATLFDQAGSTGSDDALLLTAKGKHAYDNGLNYEVTVDGGNFNILITHDTDDSVNEDSGALADRAAAVAWSADSEYVDVTLGDSAEDPRAQSGSFSGGTDDADNITETERQAAIDLFEKRYGCGVIIEPGVTSTAGALRLAAHALANNRLALADIADAATVGDAETFMASVEDQDGSHLLKVNKSWEVVPGPTAGTTRTLPWSVIEAGILGRNDVAGLPVGQPAAGAFGITQYGVGLSTEYSDADRETLNDARVNVAVDLKDGVQRGYGNRTASTTDGLGQFGAMRTIMVVQAEAEAAGEKYVHTLVDGQGIALAKYLKDLVGICQKHWVAGSLYGARAADAFRVQVFEVNTDENLLDGILNAQIDVLPSGAAEFVRINVVTHASTIGA